MTARLCEQSQYRYATIRVSNEAGKIKRERTPFKMSDWKSAKPENSGHSMTAYHI